MGSYIGELDHVALFQFPVVKMNQYVRPFAVLSDIWSVHTVFFVLLSDFLSSDFMSFHFCSAGRDGSLLHIESSSSLIAKIQRSDIVRVALCRSQTHSLTWVGQESQYFLPAFWSIQNALCFE